MDLGQVVEDRSFDARVAVFGLVLTGREHRICTDVIRDRLGAFVLIGHVTTAHVTSAHASGQEVVVAVALPPDLQSIGCRHDVSPVV